MLAEGNELPPKHALNQQTTLDHGQALIIADFSIMFTFSKITEFYDDLQTFFFLVTQALSKQLGMLPGNSTISFA